jgi:hypothetical protein
MYNPLKVFGFLLCACATADSARAAPMAEQVRPDFTFALLRYDGAWNPRPTGLVRLAWEIRRRTSVAVALEVAGADPLTDAIFEYPLLVWQGDRGFSPLADGAITRLRQHLSKGGTLLVDASDGRPDGPFLRAVKRELRRIFPNQELARVPPDHVLYKSYYLLDRHGGRVPAQPFLEGLLVQDRLAVVVTGNDLAGAMARDEFGQWVHDVGAGGDATREVTFRLGVNLVMYALCLDYKEDQVHIPFILRRRR